MCALCFSLVKEINNLVTKEMSNFDFILNKIWREKKYLVKRYVLNYYFLFLFTV